MVLITARGGGFGLEQPGSSLMEYFERFRWLYYRLRALWVQQTNVKYPTVTTLHTVQVNWGLL